MDLAAQVRRQQDLYIARGYPRLAHLTEQSFRDLTDPLVERAAQLGPTSPGTGWWTPVLLVITAALIDPAARQERTHLVGAAKPGIVDKNHGDPGLDPYRPIPEVSVPTGSAYLVTDVQRGEEFVSIAPKEALTTVLHRGRTPLTIDEGISLTTVFPDALEKNKCFMLAGSRRGDKRVPAMWIADQAPKLGWCWESNPHTWLGLASAGARHYYQIPGGQPTFRPLNI